MMDEEKFVGKVEGAPVVEEKPIVKAEGLVEEESMIQKASKAAERLEQANAKMQDMLTQQERLMTRQIMGGRADAGKVHKTQAQLDEEYINAEVERALKRFK